MPLGESSKCRSGPAIRGALQARNMHEHRAPRIAPANPAVPAASSRCDGIAGCPAGWEMHAQKDVVVVSGCEGTM